MFKLEKYIRCQNIEIYTTYFLIKIPSLKFHLIISYLQNNLFLCYVIYNMKKRAVKYFAG